MNDLISRQAILKHIEKLRRGAQMMDDTHRADLIMTGMYLCEEAVINEPSAQPERKTAKDIYNTAHGHCEFKCSACGVEIGVVEGGELEGGYFNFCPKCGARMEGGSDE